MSLERIFKDLNMTFLLESLDSMENAISIYDDRLRLVYANDSYCRNMYIDDRTGMLGKTIDEIIKESGVKIFAMQVNREQVILHKVLEYGKAFVDWEVKLFKEDKPQETKMLLFDMWPLYDKQGYIRGVVETSHSRHSDLKKLKKIVNFEAKYTFDDILGESEAIKNTIWQAVHFADNSFNLHIYGESGVGKELFAQAVHNAGSNRQGPFVALNCASFPENLIESELFGYVGGAFTGASKNGRISKFELAEGGTLFLDEIGEMPLQFQAKLLRVLEEKTVTRIGSSASIPFNTRIISATNRDLEKMVEEGAFRRDLYYRLQVLSLEIPPLRERDRDVLIIADRFLKEIALQSGGKKKRLSAEAEKEMLRYEWQGNIRELKNVVNRLTVLTKGETIGKEELQTAVYSKGHIGQKTEIPTHGSKEGYEGEYPLLSPEERIAAGMKRVEAANVELIKEALSLADGNKGEAAKLMGVSRKTMYNLVHRYKIEE